MRRIDTTNFQRATRRTLREVNRQIVLNLVRDHQPISRADLARRMKVARAIVTKFVNELLAEGVIHEVATGNAPRGRKPTLLSIRATNRLVVAIDICFSQTNVMLGDFGGRELAREMFATPLPPEQMVHELTSRVRRLLDAHAHIGTCEGIGVVVPGMVERRTGRVLHAPTIGWRNVELRQELATALGIPVHVERDAVACALAQLWQSRGNGEEADSFVYVLVSDGVGTGVVMNGALIRGHRDAAGEFGHVPLNLDGPPCLCGARGCWEAYTSNPATIARYFGRELTTRESHAELRERGFTLTDLIARARSGDAAAMAALRESARYLGVGMAGIINGLNPARIIVGGEVARAWDLVDDTVRSALTERTLTADAARTPVIPEPSDGQTRLRGAAALVVAPLFAAPVVG